jgi:hypothetical protein
VISLFPIHLVLFEPSLSPIGLIKCDIKFIGAHHFVDGAINRF